MNTNYNAETVKLSMHTIIHTLNSKLNDYQVAVETEFASLYTKDDVSKLLQKFSNHVLSVLDEHAFTEAEQSKHVQEESTGIKSQLDIDHIMERVVDVIDSALQNMRQDEIAEVDYDSAEFDIRSGNELQLTHVDVDVDRDRIHDRITNELEELHDELIDIYLTEKTEQ